MRSKYFKKKQLNFIKIRFYESVFGRCVRLVGGCPRSMLALKTYCAYILKNIYIFLNLGEGCRVLKG